MLFNALLASSLKRNALRVEVIESLLLVVTALILSGNKVHSSIVKNAIILVISAQEENQMNVSIVNQLIISQLTLALATVPWGFTIIREIRLA